MNIKTDFKYLKWDIIDQIGRLSVDRPANLNALNEGVLQELDTLFTELANSPKEEFKTIKGLIFKGEGEKAFIAGADIKEMAEMGPEQARRFGELGQTVTLKLENLPFPTIAAVQGFALGGGMEMAMSCDIVLATENAVFGQPEVKLGLIPGFGGTQRLAKIVGRGLAKELIFTGRNLHAEEAHRAGLVQSVFENTDKLIENALDIFSQIKKASPLAISYAKKALNEGVDLPTPKGLALEMDQFTTLFGSEDKREGTSAFIEKRKPSFQGK